MVNLIRYAGIVLTVAMVFVATTGARAHGFFPKDDNRHSGSPFGQHAMSPFDVWLMKQYAAQYFAGRFGNSADDVEETMQEFDPVADYETSLPNETVPRLPKIESQLLIGYLEDPSDARSALVMAIYHLFRLPLVDGFGRGSWKTVQSIQHAVYAQYFLLRAKELGANEIWIGGAVRHTEWSLAAMLPTHRPLDLTEGRHAHDFFLEAFNYKEETRYQAEALLLKDLLKNPTGLLTNLYVSAVNLWNAGEAGYDDPVMLYSFVKASYFGKRATELSRRAEQEWESDPDNHSLFRLAPTVGGFSIPSRRWLAKFQGNTEAVALLDAEIEQWRVKYPVFYMFPAGVSTFTEPDNYFNGFLALLAAFDKCVNEPNIFCLDHPRVTYNNISFFIYAFDYFMKVGDTGSALAMLDFKYVPVFRYDTWTLGHDAWRHREENLDAIAALYQNGDPTDDPINVFLKRHKWGPESSTCQLCHQVQGASWTDEEKETPVELDEAARYVQDWPEPKVSWTGAVLESGE